jgi:hypothetical protein
MPQETKQKLKINYTIQTQVNKVEKINNLWYVNFLGSWESMNFGEEKPWEEGARIKITFEEITDDTLSDR